MKAYITIISIISCIIFSSCTKTQETSNKTPDEVESIDSFPTKQEEVIVSDVDINDDDDIDEDEEIDDENVDNLKVKLAKAIRCIANNNAKGFASRCNYPVRINCLDKTVNTPEEMIELFDILFPQDQRHLFQNKSEKDWEEMGSNGIMYGGGDFWDSNFDGKISAINFASNAVNELEEKKIEAASSCLHPSLQSKEWKILKSFKCNDGTIFRIDYKDNDEKCRFLLFKQGEAFNTMPSYVMYGEYAMEDEGYHFSDEDGNTATFYELRVYEDSPYVLMLSSGTEVDGITLVNWMDLVENQE